MGIMHHHILTKIILFILILSIASFNVPTGVFAKQNVPKQNDRITINEPRVLTTPERDIPLRKPKMKFNKWVWIGAGVLAAGAIAAAASGGSDDSSDSSPSGNNGDTGEITIEW